MMMMSRTVAPRAVTSRAEKATRSARRGTSATRSVVTSASSAVERVVKGVERACDKVNLAAITAMTTLTSAGAAHAVDVQGVEDYLLAFWKFRTADPKSIFLYTVAPILGPYAIFAVLIKQKTARQLETLEAGGWVEFMAERGLDAKTLQLTQLNAFVKAAEQGLLDDAMVTEFVRKLQVNEQWNKSTIAIQDKRAEDAKKRARTQAILEAKRARGDFDAKKEESSV